MERRTDTVLTELRVRHFVDGRPIDAASRRAHQLTPQFTDAGRTTVPMAGPEEIDRFVRLAGEGLARWLAIGTEARLRAAHAVHAACGVHTFELAEALADDFGIPCELAVKSIRNTNGRFHQLLEERTPSLLPLGLYVIATGPARAGAHFVDALWPLLLAGSVVIVNPAPEAPRTMTAIAEIASAAGLLDGVFNVVHGDERTTGYLTSHPLVAGAIGIGVSARTAAAADLAEGLGKRAISLQVHDEIVVP